jgi:hypothetical protein
MDEELDPQIKLKLLEASRAAAPDYPDIKKGIGCGAAALVLSLLVSVTAVSFFQRLSLSSRVSIVIGVTLVSVLIAGGLAAFRPPKR